MREHRHAGPVSRLCHQAGLDRIGHYIGELFHHRLLGEQPHYRALFVIPHRPLPLAKRLRTEGDEPMEVAQKSGKHRLGSVMTRCSCVDMSVTACTRMPNCLAHTART